MRVNFLTLCLCVSAVGFHTFTTEAQRHRENLACRYASIGEIMIRAFGGVKPQIHPSAFVDESAQVIGDVHLGEESSIWCNAVVRGDMFYIRIGSRTNVQDNSVIHTRTGSHPTILEDQVTIGHSVTLHGCHIEKGSLIGIGSIVLDDVRVGTQSLVAAGCLLTPGMIVPPRSLVMGSPAKVKRPLTPEEVISLDLFWQNYVTYTKKYLQQKTDDG